MSASSSLDSPAPIAPTPPDPAPIAPADPASDATQTPRGLLKTLESQFPALRDHLPLALGIDKTLLERFPELNKKLLRVALSQHTRATRYLRATSKATHRFDLDGNPVAPLAEEHRLHAAETLRERLKKQNEAKRAGKTPRKENTVPPPIPPEKLALLVKKFTRD